MKPLFPHRTALLLTLGLALTACSKAPAPSAQQAAPSGYTLKETVTANGDDLVIPYQKFTLDNGLTVIVHEDHSDPLVHVDISYHVGSAREEAQRSGFAHFFEHMMFQGSEHVADEEHIKTVSESGGQMNGGTSFDKTSYFETVPSNQLEKMLWLEADRMGYFLNAVTQEKFENQRSTVKNERNQRYENTPYGLWTEKTFTAMFPAGHPYSWMPIGFIQDLDAATLDDLKQFFLRWYGPNNATLTVGGNVSADEVMKLAVKYFGEIPAGPAVTAAPKQPVTLDADRYISYIDPNIRFPALIVSYPGVPEEHADRVPLEALVGILGEGRKSWMYKEFVLPRKAIEADASLYALELAGLMNFFILPFPGTPLDKFEADLRKVLAGFNESSISDDDITIYKATQEAQLLRLLSSVNGKVNLLAQNETYRHNPNQIAKELADIRALTKADVLRVFNTYIKDKAAVYLSVVPPGGEKLLAKQDNYTVPARPLKLEGNGATLEMRRGADSFDRSKKPVAGANPLVTMPDYWQQTLDNGISFIGTSKAEVPQTTLRLIFEGGHLLEKPAQYGLASLTAAMMDEGTDSHTAEAFEKELEKLGSSISVGAGNETTTFSVTSLDRNLDATLALLQERLFHSKFTQDDLDRLKKQQIENLQAALKEPSSIAANVWNKLMYGDKHAFAVSAAGTVATVGKLTLNDVTAFSKQSLTAPALKVVIVGNISQQEALAKLAFLNELPKTAAAIAAQPAAPERNGNTLYLIDKAGAAQSEIRVGYAGKLGYDPTGEYFERQLMNYPLGQAFNSRINLNLREKKGYTYGARSGFTATKIPGPFSASASVRADATVDSIVQFVDEIKNYRDNGITADELAFTKNSIGQSEALDYETPGQKAGLLQRIATYGLQNDYVKKQQQIIADMTAERINSLSKTHLPLENMQILVVGDKKVFNDGLKALGYKIVELNAEGNPL